MVRTSEKFLQQITLLAKDGYGSVNAFDSLIINALDPINPQDVATKNYVDGYISPSTSMVKVSAIDSFEGYLSDKFSVGYGLTISTLNLGPPIGLTIRVGHYQQVGNHTLSAGNNNNVSPTAWSSLFVIRFDCPGDGYITGMAALLQTDDIIVKKLYNVGSFDITLMHQNAGTSPDGRIIIPGGTNLVLEPDDVVDIYYDQTTQRWRVG